MRPVRTLLSILCAGAVTFGLVFALLQLTRSDTAPSQEVTAPAPAPTAGSLPRSTNPLVARMLAGDVAIGVPTTGSTLLLRDVQPGDRLDISASLPSPVDGRPVTGVIVRGARVLEPATGSDPLLLELPARDALALAHLILGGSHLGFVVWPANGSGPAASLPVTESAARSLFGLTPVASRSDPTVSATAIPVVVDPESVPTMLPTAPTATVPVLLTPTDRPALSSRSTGFLYQTQPLDTWDTIASIFSVPVAELKRWNEVAAGQDPTPHSLVFIPR